MNTRNLGQLAFVIVGLFVGIYAAMTIILNPTGGIAGLSKLLAIIGVIMGIIKPRGALLYLAAQAIYSDELKRIGVYYGVQSSQTISEILIGPLLTLTAINISFLHGVLRRQFKIDTLGWVLYMIAPAVTAAMIYTGRDAGWSLSLYLAATTGLYITLVPICYGLFNSREEWAGFISWQVAVAAPAAAWGLWQYFYGFNDIEWSYALSGLSRVHSFQMMMPEPRIFGLFGSASAFGCVALYATFAGWRAFRFRKFRGLFFALAILFLIAAVLSHQRSVLLFPVIVLLFSFAFRRLSTTLLFYGSIFAVFLLGVWNATYMIEEGLQKINDTIMIEGRWTENVLNVGTFSDRLRGWERLSRADTWTLFGSGKTLRSTASTELGDYAADDFNHDIVNKILINYGAIALFAILAVGVFIVFKLHQLVFNSKDWQQRKDGAFVMACIIPLFILAFIGGDNFSTTPINLQIWSIFAGIFILKKISAQEKEPIYSPAPIPQLQPAQGGIM